ncbi:unnamed protein product [Mytilus coruscus]|uniref:Uncharacterized protein n=1 Tax=Mytilus coruscus TaxID=42192 RepID=A0A6J8CKW5_MYTCO|nr:unnamed protein product [Mytilus coruscus]
MGGIVRNRDDIESISRTAKTIKLKKEKLRDQLLYCKQILKMEIPKTAFAYKNTLAQLKDNLVSFLQLDKEKEITVGTWVAISFEDDWYPGEVLQLKPENILNINFMARQRKKGITFKWPSKEDIKDIDMKFVIYSHFDILPSPGLRHWIISDIDDINHHHNQFVEKYFVQE